MSKETKIDFWLMVTLKGNVGKTKMARLLAETCLIKKWLFLVIDCDTANKAGNSLDQIYNGIDLPYLSNRNISDTGRDAIFDAVQRLLVMATKSDPKTPRHVIIDIGAGEADRFLGELHTMDLVTDIVDGGHRLRLLAPITSSPDSLAGLDRPVTDGDGPGLIQRISTTFSADGVSATVVLDPAMGKSPEQAINMPLQEAHFPNWFSDPISAKAKAAGIDVVDIPMIDAPAAYESWMADNRTRTKPVGLRAWALEHQDVPSRHKRVISKWIDRCATRLAPWMSGETERGKGGKA